MAENLGHRVLLLDASFSAAGVGAVAGFAGERGFADLLPGSGPGSLPGSLELFDTLVRPTAHPAISVLPAGGEVRGGSAALKAADLQGLLRRAYPKFGYVIVQGPALLDDPRALLFLPHADRVLLLAEEDRTLMEDLEASRRLLNPARPGQLGLVLVRPPRRWVMGGTDGPS